MKNPLTKDLEERVARLEMSLAALLVQSVSTLAALEAHGESVPTLTQPEVEAVLTRKSEEEMAAYYARKAVQASDDPGSIGTYL